MSNRLKVTIVGYIGVSDDDLESYDALTIEEAAHNQQQWNDSGGMGADEIISLCGNVTITVDPIATVGVDE